MKTIIKAAPTSSVPFSELQPRRFKKDLAEQLARLMDFANAGGTEFVERYIAEMELKAARNGGTLTSAEWYHVARARDAKAILDGRKTP